MLRPNLFVFFGAIFVAASIAPPTSAVEPDYKIPAGIRVEEPPLANSTSAKIVIVAGSSYFKPGEHEYLGGCAVLFDLLKQSPNVFPVLAVDWPKKAETFAGAKAVVFFFDGGDAKHPLLQRDRLQEVKKLADAGVGLVHFHQAFDYPQALKVKAQEFTGAAFEKGYSQRAHWVDEFSSFSNHPIFSGVTPFKIDDGWLYKLRFAPEMKGISPLLRTVNPKTAANKEIAGDNETVVAWTYERPQGGRSFTFTGCHLHASLAEEGYRRFLVNGILWSAGIDIPATGALVQLASSDLDKYLEKRTPTK